MGVHSYLGDPGVCGHSCLGDPGVCGHSCLGDPGVCGHSCLGDPGVCGHSYLGDPGVCGAHRAGSAANLRPQPPGRPVLPLRVQRQRPHLGQPARSLLTAAPGGGPRAEDAFRGERLCVETPPSPLSTSPSAAPLEKAPPLFPRRKDVREVHEVLRFNVTSQPCQEVSESMSMFSIKLKFRRLS